MHAQPIARIALVPATALSMPTKPIHAETMALRTHPLPTATAPTSEPQVGRTPLAQNAEIARDTYQVNAIDRSIVTLNATKMLYEMGRRQQKSSRKLVSKLLDSILA